MPANVLSSPGRYHILGAGVMVLATITACGPVHKTLRPTDIDMKPITSITVVIPEEGKATVFYHRAKATATPAIMFGLIGASIASATNASRDGKKAETLHPHLEKFSCRKALFGAFQRALTASGRYREVLLADTPHGKPTTMGNGVVTLRIDNWGLRLARQDSEDLSAFVEVGASLIDPGTGRKLWDEHGTYLSTQSYPLSKYQQDGDLLQAGLVDALERAAGDLADRLVYPVGGSR